MHEQLSNDPVASADWERLRPVIDETLGELNARDREAVLLRFFASLPLAAVGEKLNLTENAARMRVERALGKLHALLAKRGVTSTAAAVGLMLANEASVAAPAGLAASVESVLGQHAQPDFLDLVAERGGPLELQVLRGVPHLRVEPRHELLHLPPGAALQLVPAPAGLILAA